MSKQALIAGSINVDLIVRIDRLPMEGETLIGHDFIHHPGGKGANQASALALQGVPTGMWGCVGQDAYGQMMLENLAQHQIQSFVHCTSSYTGLALIETDKHGKNRIVVVPGANSLFCVELIQSQIQIIDHFDVIVVQFEIPLPTVEYLAVKSKKLGKTVIVNPALAMHMSELLLSNTDYLIPNEHELALITGLPTRNLDQVKTATRSLHDRGVRTVIVTMCEQGSYFSSEKYCEIVPGLPVKALDTTGAGDAFVGGGFTGALLKNGDEIFALRHANTVAALSVMKIGAFGSAGTWDEAQKFLKTAQI